MLHPFVPVFIHSFIPRALGLCLDCVFSSFFLFCFSYIILWASAICSLCISISPVPFCTTMFHATGSSFDLSCLNKQQLLQQYESEEEDVSESEVGQDNSFSPVDLQRCDSDMSADEVSNVDDPDTRRTNSGCLPSSQPTDSKASRTMSMKGIKRRSDATFVAGSYIYDQDDDVIIELPSAETSPQLQSSAFLQPGGHTAESQRSSSRLSMRSPSPASCLSDDESDVCVAEQVTYVEPSAKPNLIQISPTTSQPSPTSEISTPTRFYGYNRAISVKQEQPDKLSPLRRSAELLIRRATSTRRVPLGECVGDGNTRTPQETGRPGPMQREKSLEQPGSSATINCLSEVPTVPYPMSPRSQSISISRPRTSASERAPTVPPAMHSRSASRSIRRPPSLLSMNSFQFPFWQSRPASPRVEGPHLRSNSYSPSVFTPDSVMPRNGRPFSGIGRPVPYCSSPISTTRDRSDSAYSASNLSVNSSLPTRKPTVKHSAEPSIHSTTSCRSDRTSDQNFNGQGTALPDTDFEQTASRKKSFRRGKAQQSRSPEKSTGKFFLGLRLGGRRKSVTKLSDQVN